MAIILSYDDVLGGTLYYHLDETKSVYGLYREVIGMEKDPTFIEWLTAEDKAKVHKIKEDYQKLDTLNKLYNKI